MRWQHWMVKRPMHWRSSQFAPQTPYKVKSIRQRKGSKLKFMPLLRRLMLTLSRWNRCDVHRQNSTQWHAIIHTYADSRSTPASDDLSVIAKAGNDRAKVGTAELLLWERFRKYFRFQVSNISLHNWFRNVARIVSLGGQLQYLGADIFRVLLYCYSLLEMSTVSVTEYANIVVIK